METVEFPLVLGTGQYQQGPLEGIFSAKPLSHNNCFLKKKHGNGIHNRPICAHGTFCYGLMYMYCIVEKFCFLQNDKHNNKHGDIFNQPLKISYSNSLVLPHILFNFYSTTGLNGIF